MSEAHPNDTWIAWRSARLWAGIAAVASALVTCIGFVDLPLALYLKRTVSKPVFDVFYQICRIGEGGLWAALGVSFWVVPRARRWWRHRQGQSTEPDRRPWDIHAAFLLSVLAINGIIVNILKHALGRYRPAKFFETGEHAFDFFVIFQKSDSFPSGHAATIWGAMLALWFIYPRLRWLYVPVAVVVSLGRLVVHKHYLGDVVAGAALALAVCLLCKRAIERRYGPVFASPA